jgi:glucose uptake protein GlcU
MKINPTSRMLYFYAGLTFLAFFLVIYLLHTNLNWQAFFDAATAFLPMALGLTLAAILLFTGIYLLTKGRNQGKDKKHVRYL